MKDLGFIFGESTEEILEGLELARNSQKDFEMLPTPYTSCKDTRYLGYNQQR